MDRIDPGTRSANMARIGRRDTAPEIAVRKALHRLGLRFRLHRRDLPGTPDIVLPRHRTVVFVHGCFWHRHTGCRRTTVPATRPDFWLAKFEANVRRDKAAEAKLRALGWQVAVVWECEAVMQHTIVDTLDRQAPHLLETSGTSSSTTGADVGGDRSFETYHRAGDL